MDGIFMQLIESKEILGTFLSKTYCNDRNSPSYPAVKLSKFMCYDVKITPFVSNKTRNIDDKCVAGRCINTNIVINGVLRHRHCVIYVQGR